MSSKITHHTSESTNYE